MNGLDFIHFKLNTFVNITLKTMKKYTEQILVRLKEGQNEILKKEADKHHTSVSTYVRMKLFNNKF